MKSMVKFFAKMMKKIHLAVQICGPTILLGEMLTRNFWARVCSI